MLTKLLYRSYQAHIAYYVLRNVRKSLQPYNRRLATGGAYSTRTPQEAAQRALKWISLFLKQTGTDPERNKIDLVLEVGPGDSLIIPLLWIGMGASRSFGIDAFNNPCSVDREREIIRCVFDAVPNRVRQRMAEVVDVDADEIFVDQDRLRYIPNTPVEHLDDVTLAEGASVICSVSVLEHVRNLATALEKMYFLLKADGVMCHHVDLRNHGVLSEFGDSAFLRPSEMIWNLMSSNCALPNRKDQTYYEQTMRNLGAEVRIAASSDGRSDDGANSDRLESFWLVARRKTIGHGQA